MVKTKREPEMGIIERLDRYSKVEEWALEFLPKLGAASWVESPPSFCTRRSTEKACRGWDCHICGQTATAEHIFSPRHLGRCWHHKYAPKGAPPEANIELASSSSAGETGPMLAIEDGPAEEACAQVQDEEDERLTPWSEHLRRRGTPWAPTPRGKAAPRAEEDEEDERLTPWSEYLEHSGIVAEGHNEENERVAPSSSSERTRHRGTAAPTRGDESFGGEWHRDQVETSHLKRSGTAAPAPPHLPPPHLEKRRRVAGWAFEELQRGNVASWQVRSFHSVEQRGTAPWRRGE